MIPCWGNYDGYHLWVQLIDRVSHNTSHLEKINKNIPKIYRGTFSKHMTYQVWIKMNILLY